MPTILVVDDAKTMRDTLRDLLAPHGFDIYEADNGESGLDMLGKQAIDLVISDLNMPGMDGIETLQRLRALPGCASLPVIAMTADATEAHRKRYLAAGMNGYLAKPLTPEAVAEMLRLYLPAAR